MERVKVTPGRVLAVLVLVLLAACGSNASPACPEVGQDVTAEVEAAQEPGPEVLVEEVALEAEASGPTPWSAAATDPLIVDDIPYATWKGQRVFALGFDAKKGPTYDGFATEGCDQDALVGYVDDVLRRYDLAIQAGANFTFIWGYPGSDWVYHDEWLDRVSMLYGKWYDGWSVDRPPERDVMPIVHNEWGESDFDNEDIEGTIAEHLATFEEWKARTGRFSPEARPNLPPYEELPWIGWHPTWRSRGGGDGTGEVLTDAQAEGLINSANFGFGDNYTYVTNRHPSQFNPVTGQQGEKGEGYDDWLAVADPEHASSFQAAWEVAWAVKRFARHPMLRWMWIQGYSFGYSLAAGLCDDGLDDSWATGWFPSLPYLRKEAASAIAAGATGIVYFGYLGAHPMDRDKANVIFSALSHPDVYGPALLSPRLAIAPEEDLAFAGEGGRVHAIVKWDAASGRAFVIGANPGPWQTVARFTFPWSLEKAEVLMWGSGRFVESPRLAIEDRTLVLTAPMDEGFLVRVTPLQ
jgi:hypothetical protein